MSDTEEDPRGVPFVLGLLVGGATMLAGLYGLLHNDLQTRPGNLVRYVIGGLVSHDALLVPAVAVVGFVLARVVPARVRGAVQATLVVMGALVLVSIPVLKHAGRRPDNPSLLPHDYTHNLLIVLAIVAVLGVVGRVAARR